MLLEEIEDEFLVQLPRANFKDVKTIGEMHARVVRVLKKREKPDEEKIWSRIVEIVSIQSGRDMENISATDRLEELGLPALVEIRSEGVKKWLGSKRDKDQDQTTKDQKKE